MSDRQSRKKSDESGDQEQQPKDNREVGAGMRVIVPLQGIVQGRGGIGGVVLGSVIPCALLYCVQLYLKSRRKGGGAGSSGHGNSEDGQLQSPPPLPLPRRPSRNPLAPPFVSSRALHASDGEDSAYYRGWSEYEENPYSAEKNPDGVIQMGLAENQLSVDIIQSWLEAHPEASSLVEESSGFPLTLRGIAGYQDYYGMENSRVALNSPLFRSNCDNCHLLVHRPPEPDNSANKQLGSHQSNFDDITQVMADFMTKVMNASFHPSRIVLTAGSTAAIEALGFCLADPGNAFLVPSPYYPGFDRDLKWRANVELVPVPCRSSDNFLVTMTALDRAYTQAKKRGLAVRALLVTNPSNPVGNLMSMDMLSDLLEFATEKNIHLICNELYAASVYDESRFTSIARLLDTGDYDKSRVHIIYGLSKDLCLPGFRVGVLYSYNDKVLKAVQRLARFCSVSTQTQKILSTMLSDSSFIEKYLTENQKRLKERSSIFVEGLKEAGIRCIKGNAGLYCWVEMASLMPSYNEKGELILWEKILSEAKINVTPGSACHCIEPGWFRFTFSNLSDHEMAVAVKRIQEFAAHCKN